MLVAVITRLVAARVTVTGWVSTPLTKLADAVVGVMIPAVVVRVTVPLKPVAVLLNASRAVRVTLKGVPAACVPTLAKTKCVAVPAVTVKPLLAPMIGPALVAVITRLVAARVTVTGWVSTPLTNEADVVGVMTPAVVVRVAVPLKPEAVLPKASRAVTVTVKTEPAVCVITLAKVN
ncbi:MAG: hypothetical protein DWI58_20255, partial [Chloroflexi bacterium]